MEGLIWFIDIQIEMKYIWLKICVEFYRDKMYMWNVLWVFGCGKMYMWNLWWFEIHMITTKLMNLLSHICDDMQIVS